MRSINVVAGQGQDIQAFGQLNLEHHHCPVTEEHLTASWRYGLSCESAPLRAAPGPSRSKHRNIGGPSPKTDRIACPIDRSDAQRCAGRQQANYMAACVGLASLAR